uniref:Uncharacterized protein n=1 Tax=Ditylenchus dipsaci TaxID=166011 RepID=A0A915DUX7_9BILA
MAGSAMDGSSAHKTQCNRCLYYGHDSRMCTVSVGKVDRCRSASFARITSVETIAFLSAALSCDSMERLNQQFYLAHATFFCGVVAISEHTFNRFIVDYVNGKHQKDEAVALRQAHYENVKAECSDYAIRKVF